MAILGHKIPSFWRFLKQSVSKSRNNLCIPPILGHQKSHNRNTSDKKASLLLRHLDHKFVRELRAETLAKTYGDVYANMLLTDPEKEAKRKFYVLQPLPNEFPDLVIKRLTLADAACNFGANKDQEIMQQALAKITNERWQIRADVENWSHASLAAGKANAKRMVALKTRIHIQKW